MLLCLRGPCETGDFGFLSRGGAAFLVRYLRGHQTSLARREGSLTNCACHRAAERFKPGPLHRAADGGTLRFAATEQRTHRVTFRNSRRLYPCRANLTGGIEPPKACCSRNHPVRGRLFLCFSVFWFLCSDAVATEWVVLHGGNLQAASLDSFLSSFITNVRRLQLRKLLKRAPNWWPP